MCVSEKKIRKQNQIGIFSETTHERARINNNYQNRCKYLNSNYS